MKKLIVIDEGLVKHKAIFAYIGQYEANLKAIIADKKCSDEAAIDILERKIRNKEVWMMYPPSLFLKMCIGYMKKLGVTLDDTVIVAEDYGSWRKAEDLSYKAQRKAYRESRMSADWWKDMYKTFNELMVTLSACLPWQFIKSYHCESDDVASVAVRFLEADEKILISTDEDWHMLCSIPNVKIFSPYSKKFKIIKSPEAILLKKISKGDKSDNLSPLPENATEKEYETRKLIVNLLHLPHYVEEPIIELLFKTVPKNVYLSKIPFRACKQQIKQLYNL